LHLGHASIPSDFLRSFRTAHNHLCNVNSSIKCQSFSDWTKTKEDFSLRVKVQFENNKLININI
jgi:hypothetical protein